MSKNPVDPDDLNSLGHAYYTHCISTALAQIEEARALVKGDVVEKNHQLHHIEDLLRDALDAS